VFVAFVTQIYVYDFAFTLPHARLRTSLPRLLPHFVAVFAACRYGSDTHTCRYRYGAPLRVARCTLCHLPSLRYTRERSVRRFRCVRYRRWVLPSAHAVYVALLRRCNVLPQRCPAFTVVAFHAAVTVAFRRLFPLSLLPAFVATRFSRVHVRLHAFTVAFCTLPRVGCRVADSYDLRSFVTVLRCALPVYCRYTPLPRCLLFAFTTFHAVYFVPLSFACVAFSLRRTRLPAFTRCLVDCRSRRCTFPHTRLVRLRSLRFQLRFYHARILVAYRCRFAVRCIRSAGSTFAR